MNPEPNPRDSWPAWTDQPAGWPIAAADNSNPVPERVIVRRHYRGNDGLSDPVTVITRIWNRKSAVQCQLCPEEECVLRAVTHGFRKLRKLLQCVVVIVDDDAGDVERN